LYVYLIFISNPLLKRALVTSSTPSAEYRNSRYAVLLHSTKYVLSQKQRNATRHFTALQTVTLSDCN